MDPVWVLAGAFRLPDSMWDTSVQIFAALAFAVVLLWALAIVLCYRAFERWVVEARK